MTVKTHPHLSSLAPLSRRSFNPPFLHLLFLASLQFSDVFSTKNLQKTEKYLFNFRPVVSTSKLINVLILNFQSCGL